MTVRLSRKGKLPPAKTAEEFRTMHLPEKEALVEGILFRRDLVAFAGRRRHGKTSILVQLALSLCMSACSDFFGHTIPQKRRVLLYLLEDDSRELQDRLNRMLDDKPGKGDTEGRLIIRTKDDFYGNDLQIGVRQKDFREAIEQDCQDHKPDVIMFDHLGFLVGADYNDASTIYDYVKFTIALSQKYDCAIVTTAHPRKQSDLKSSVTLEKDRDMFFEEVMGSSHFVNSSGSLWGIERTKDGCSNFYVGAQRMSGNALLVAIEIADDGWFHIADDFDRQVKLLVNTEKRRLAWAAFPETFTYTQALEAAKAGIKSKGAFNPWWQDLKRVGLITSLGDGRFKKSDKITNELLRTGSAWAALAEE